LRQSGEQIFGFNCPSPPPSFLPCMVWRGTRSNTWEPAAKWLQLWLANLDRHFRGPLHLGHLQRVDADSNTLKTFSRLESFSNLIREPETLAIPFLTSRSRRERFSDRAGQAGNANMLPNSVPAQSLPRACPVAEPHLCARIHRGSSATHPNFGVRIVACSVPIIGWNPQHSICSRASKIPTHPPTRYWDPIMTASHRCSNG